MVCHACQAGVEHESCNHARRDRLPPRGRGSNYEKKRFCRRCGRRTTHLYDHGDDIHRCAECEL